MSSKGDFDDIVQSFVDNDLSSLDRFGDKAESFTLSPHLAQPSPDLTSPSSVGSSRFPSNSGSSAKTGPQVSNSIDTATAASSDSGGFSGNSPRVTAPDHSASTGTTAPIKNVSENRATSNPVSSPAPVSHAPVNQRQTSTGSNSSQGYNDEANIRKSSVSSTASVSTAEREKHQSFGDRFKKFGKRIASGSKK